MTETTAPAAAAGNVAGLTAALAAARAENRAAVIGYLPAGLPTKEGAIRALTAMLDGGCDAVEVGLPYSDPVLDGPVIQAADTIALAGGTRTADVLDTVREVAAATGKPVLVMTSWNPVDHYGQARFAADLAAAGGAGAILPELPVEESGTWRAAADAAGLGTVFVVAPSSPDSRLAVIGAAGSGFVYAASVMGVTGTRDTVGARAEELVARVRKATDLPVCVGLGVSNGDQAAEVGAFADGVIVGTAFVRRILDAPDEDTAIAGLATLAGELAAGVRRSQRRVAE